MITQRKAVDVEAETFDNAVHFLQQQLQIPPTASVEFTLVTEISSTTPTDRT